MGAEMIVRIAALVLLALLLADRNSFGQQAPAAADQPASSDKTLDGRADDPAEKEMLVARWYLGRHDYTGVLNRSKIVITQHCASRHVEEALAHLTEAYLALGIVREAQAAAAELGRKFPDSRWYAKAYGLLKSVGLEPREDESSGTARIFKCACAFAPRGSA
jgi:outer membrane protein assembly factor BamD